MKRTVITAALALLASAAHAESFFQIEAGLGFAHTQTLNDGVWYQQGLPGDNLHVNTPVYTIGLTGEAWRASRVDVRWHADYVYIGQQSASCMCVADEAYDANKHQVLSNYGAAWFDGFGHVQGLVTTLDLGYTWRGVRFGIEAGPWLMWETWHENSRKDWGWENASHHTTMQVSWVAGASVSRGPWALSYRYYNMPQLWNPFPGLVRAAHVGTLTYTW